ncbi:MAG: cation:proton antiporter [Rhodothermales bacterium]|nr:cation:proton antiporter [Rhodothermales bacterium]MBO6778041.1 cation:proton antiporter [Rhodothermales bacterium]
MKFILAAGAAPPFFVEVALLILCSAGIAYVCYRLGIVPIVGFLITGVVIGPMALGLVQDQEVVDAAAEVGVLLLLFTIGIEFSLEKLARIQRLIFAGGGLQVGLAAGITTGLLMAFGVSWQAGLFTGFLVALSSTAIVLKLLGDSGEIDTEHGQVGLGLLIFQDLAIILMVLLVPLLSGTGGSTLQILGALGKAIGIIVLVLLVARRVMPLFLEAVARTCSPELFLLTVIGICFGTAYLTSLAGVSLSLGAFLAGLVVSESKFSEHAMGEIMPLQILFSATFFVSVGMLLDLSFLIANLPLVLGVVMAVLIIKIITTGIAVRSLGYSLPVVAGASLMLAQIGEFSFVLERSGREAGLFPAGMEGTGSQTFIAATVLVMIATPALNSLGARIRKRLEAPDGDSPQEMDEVHQHGPLPELDGHVIIAGFGNGARKLVRSLDQQEVPFVVLTLSPEGANEAESMGVPVLRGDYARQHTLELAGIEKARTLIIADDHPAMAHRVAMVARTIGGEDLHIVVRTRHVSEIPGLHADGVDCVIADELESIVQLMCQLLKDRGLPADEIDRRAEDIRGKDYAGLLADNKPSDVVVLNVKGVACDHADHPLAVVPNSPGVCTECQRMGDTWVHLRVCMTCGHVGCCDSSKNKHASAHFHETGHPVMRSMEPGEKWGWCFEHGLLLK